MTIKENALRWWAAQTQKDVFVVTSNEIPDRRQREYLTKAGFLFNAMKGYWILKKPEDSVDDVFPLIYWQFVKKTLARLGPCSVWGKSALSLFSGDQKAQKYLSVKTVRKTNRKLFLPLNFEISLITDPDFDETFVKKLDVAGHEIPVDMPEKILIDASRLKLGDEAKGFIAGTKFNKRIIEVLYADNPKPFVFKRLMEMAKDADRPDLVGELQRIVESYTHYKIGRKEKFDQKLVDVKPVALKAPWVIRQEQQINRFEEILEKKLPAKVKGLKTYSLKRLIQQANEHKKYDTYHSTTLEGYQVTPEQVDALLSGDTSKRKAKGESVEQIKNNMAIVGYSKAFDFVTQKVTEDFHKTLVSEELVQDIYYHLFKPSVDAGIIDRKTLVGYRNNPVFIKGTMYVPPAYEKLTELMADFESLMNKIKHPVIRAVLTHYLFVTIHPYNDGNGRTARLLMNYLLLTSGYPWITIRADQQIEYFSALNTANIDENILPFGRFIVALLESVGRKV